VVQALGAREVRVERLARGTDWFASEARIPDV